jgi:hypothetical protein
MSHAEIPKTYPLTYPFGFETAEDEKAFREFLRQTNAELEATLQNIVRSRGEREQLSVQIEEVMNSLRGRLL